VPVSVACWNQRRRRLFSARRRVGRSAGPPLPWWWGRCALELAAPVWLLPPSPLWPTCAAPPLEASVAVSKASVCWCWNCCPRVRRPPPSVRAGGRGWCCVPARGRAPALLGPCCRVRFRRCPPRRGSLEGFPSGHQCRSPVRRPLENFQPCSTRYVKDHRRHSAVTAQSWDERGRARPPRFGNCPSNVRMLVIHARLGQSPEGATSPGCRLPRACRFAGSWRV
jgi:hypothetical protein